MNPRKPHTPRPGPAHWPLRLSVRAALRAPGRDRGTVLLMVVGVLALLAIIGVVYATIGQGDRRAAGTLITKQRIGDQVDEVASYLAGVVGDSTFAVYTQKTAAAGQVMVRTRGYTYPWTDEYFLSINPDPNALPRAGVNIPPKLKERYARFSPTGTNPNDWADTDTTDARNHADPFLAVLEPEYLRINNIANNNPPQLAQLHDWRHISNFAPSGNFVNLANLRRSSDPNPARPHGGFNAPPGFKPGVLNGEPAGMSYGLTLFDPANGHSYNHMNNQPVPFAGGRNAELGRPSDWSNNQAYAFRPAVPESTWAEPWQYEYLFNQWADTDGDGFVDARWFELTDLSNLFGGSTGGNAARAVVPNRGRYRLFVAARCVDNSAMVNVNTASSFFQGPWPEWTYQDRSLSRVDARNNLPYTRDFAFPPGSSAADIDLARVLTQSDINRFLAQAGVGTPGVTNAKQGYGGIPQPQSPADAANYAQYNPTAPLAGGAHPDNIGRSAYSALIKARQLGTVPAATPYTTNNLLLPAVNGEAPFRYEDYDIFAADQTLNPYFAQGARELRPQFDLTDQLELAMFFGVNNSEAVSRLEATMGGRFNMNTNRFSPLRENRPRGLEVRGRDRFDGPTLFLNPTADTDKEAALVSVFADVRHLLTTVNGQRPIKNSSVASANDVVVPAGSVPPSLEKAAITDVSHALQVIQNHFQITDQTDNRVNQPGYAEYAAAVRLIFGLYADALMPFTDRNNNYFPNAWVAPPNAARQRYLDGLCYGGNPELALRMAAHMTANMIDMFDHERPLDTTVLPANQKFREGLPRTTEVDRNEPTILQIAFTDADLATTTTLNPIPPYLATTQPTIARQARGGVQILPRSGTDGLTGQIDPSKAPIKPLTRLAADRTSGSLRSATTYANLSGQMTVYGIEAQPFLVAVSAFQIYTDAPNHAGGDDDNQPFDPTNPDPRGFADPQTHLPSIRLRPELNHGDFVGELIAFQLHNPFDQDIVLYDDTPEGSTTANIDKVKFYIEYSGRFYCFGQQTNPDAATGGSTSGTGTSSFDQIGIQAKPTVLKAGQTQTFYVLNPGTLNQLLDRIKQIDMSLAGARGDPEADKFPTVPTVATIENWIKNQVGVKDSSVKPIQITQVFPTSFNAVQGRSAGTGFAGQQNDMDLWGEHDFNGTGANEQLVTTTDADRHVVHLWRTVRSDSTLNPTLAQFDSGSGVVDNDPTNDLLADRMHDPVPESAAVMEGTLFHARKQFGRDDSGEIPNTHAGDENDASLARRGDNTGFSFISWASIRRPTDLNWDPSQAKWGTKDEGGTRVSPTQRLRGVLPPWCMEARVDNRFAFATDTTHSPFGMNKAERAFKFGIGTREDYITDSHHERFTRLRELFSETSPVNAELPKSAVEKQNNSDVVARNFDSTGGSANQSTGRPYAEVAVEFHSVGEDSHGGYPQSGGLYIQSSRNPALFSRSGDFLLPLAIGPWFDPSRTGPEFVGTISGTTRTLADSFGNNGGGKHILDREAAWMTLAEAIALSSGYYSPIDVNDPLHDFGIHRVASGALMARPPLTDRGHPVLTAFTPYLWLETAAVPQPIGSGAPFALGIIDQFRAAFGIASTQKLAVGGDLRTGRPVMQKQEYAPGGGSLNLMPNGWSSLTLRPGFGNINTMPLTSMRALPMLSPEYDPASWMFNNIHAMPGVTPGLGDVNYDIAPTIKAYRDRSKENYRQVDATVPPDPPADFLNNARSTYTQEISTTFGADPNVSLTYRESLGFKSLGEIALANIFKPASVSTSISPNSVFRFARELDLFNPGSPTGTGTPTATQTMPGAQRLSFWPQVVGSRFYNAKIGTPDVGMIDTTNPAATATGGFGDILTLRGVQVDHSYQDKLAVVNALTNTASVRSDVFTVYFLIHGYTPEDCDIPDEQPLVPSIAKRYVMVLDRSNVVNPGDKPRVLMLKEVPIP